MIPQHRFQSPLSAFRRRTRWAARRQGSNPSHPLKQRALAVKDYDGVITSNDASCPALPADQAYVRVDAVALNSSDTKMQGAVATLWAFLGIDYCGTVAAVGSDITHTKVGDCVYGAQNEMCPRTPDQGPFDQYTITRGRIWTRVPDN
jgi:NADPH:quinone reductase-like Zn-dependent oxidoreductase